MAESVQRKGSGEVRLVYRARVHHERGGVRLEPTVFNVKGDGGRSNKKPRLDWRSTSLARWGGRDTCPNPNPTRTPTTRPGRRFRIRSVC